MLYQVKLFESRNLTIFTLALYSLPHKVCCTCRRIKGYRDEYHLTSEGIARAENLLSPSGGVFPRWVSRFSLKLRIATEDWLANVYRANESDGVLATDPLMSRIGRSRWLLLWLRVRGLLSVENGQWQLSERGNAIAKTIIRTHRSWESFMHDELDVPADNLHRAAHDVEHFLREDSAGSDEIWSAGSTDPHGSEIPE